MRASLPTRVWLPALAGFLLGLCFASPGWSEALRDWLVRQPLTNRFYEILHFPAVTLVYAWWFVSRPSEGMVAWAAFPYAIIIQWLAVGVIVGALLQFRFRSRHRKDIA
jgi:hypothetical protein